MPHAIGRFCCGFLLDPFGLTCASEASPWILLCFLRSAHAPSPASPASSSIPQWLGSAPAPPPSPWAWCRNFNLCYKHATAATSAPNRPRSRAPWGGTPGQGGHGLHLALVLLLELQCFGLGCCLLGEVAAFDVPFLWGNLHIPLLHTFAFSCPTSPSALRWWSWGPGASARWGCPSPPALHGRPWRPRELLRRPGPRRLKRQDYRGPPTPGHSEHHFASPGCFSWTALVSAPHNVLGDAQRQQLQLGLLGPFQSVGWHHCQTCLRCLYLKGPETGNSLSLPLSRSLSLVLSARAAIRCTLYYTNTSQRFLLGEYSLSPGKRSRNMATHFNMPLKPPSLCRPWWNREIAASAANHAQDASGRSTWRIHRRQWLPVDPKKFPGQQGLHLAHGDFLLPVLLDKACDHSCHHVWTNDKCIKMY